MRRELSVVFVTLLMCLTAVVIVPNENRVKAESEIEANLELDTELIYNVTSYLSNTIYNAYSDGELQKGRAFGSKGEHYAADYIYNVMNGIGLSDVHKEQIENVSGTDNLNMNIGEKYFIKMAIWYFS